MSLSSFILRILSSCRLWPTTTTTTTTRTRTSEVAAPMTWELWNGAPYHSCTPPLLRCCCYCVGSLPPQPAPLCI